MFKKPIRNLLLTKQCVNHPEWLNSQFFDGFETIISVWEKQ